MYKNIIFDLGGVVVDFTPRIFLLDRFSNEELENKLYDISFGSDTWQALDAGEMTREEGDKIMMKAAAEIGLSYEMEVVLNDWDDMLKTKDDTARLIKRLHKNGYNLYYLSNIAHDTLALIKKRHFWPLFKDGIASCNVRVTKPDLKIFNGTLRKFGLNPQETIFIDDTPINVDAAQTTGIKALLFTSVPALAKDLAALGVNLKNMHSQNSAKQKSTAQKNTEQQNTAEKQAPQNAAEVKGTEQKQS